jgi:hypothetical protein
MNRHYFTWLIAVLSIAAPARADLIPPDVYQCQGKVAGARCDTGACRPSRCTKLDYAHWDRDASSSPPVVEYDCLRCMPGRDAGSGAGGHGTKDGGAGAGGHGTKDAGSGGALADGGALSPTHSGGCDGNCALDARRPIVGRTVALLLAALVPLLVRRRRTR